MHIYRFLLLLLAFTFLVFPFFTCPIEGRSVQLEEIFLIPYLKEQEFGIFTVLVIISFIFFSELGIIIISDISVSVSTVKRLHTQMT